MRVYNPTPESVTFKFAGRTYNIPKFEEVDIPNKCEDGFNTPGTGLRGYGVVKLDFGDDKELKALEGLKWYNKWVYLRLKQQKVELSEDLRKNNMQAFGEDSKVKGLEKAYEWVDKEIRRLEKKLSTPEIEVPTTPVDHSKDSGIEEAVSEPATDDNESKKKSGGRPNRNKSDKV